MSSSPTPLTGIGWLALGAGGQQGSEVTTTRTQGQTRPRVKVLPGHGVGAVAALSSARRCDQAGSHPEPGSLPSEDADGASPGDTEKHRRRQAAARAVRLLAERAATQANQQAASKHPIEMQWAGCCARVRTGPCTAAGPRPHVIWSAPLPLRTKRRDRAPLPVVERPPCGPRPEVPGDRAGRPPLP